jgi:hypothetical protein
MTSSEPYTQGDTKRQVENKTINNVVIWVNAYIRVELMMEKKFQLNYFDSITQLPCTYLTFFER